jgi:hypothetical protein
MKPTRRQLESDDRDTAFVLPEACEPQKPGVQLAPKGFEAEAEGEHRFPRIAAEKDIPRVPLAQRIAEKK